jgi:hypothetical protein
MEKESKYRVVAHKFIGYDGDGEATYEIRFNKSLEHTGRFKGIEDGLNSYYKKEISSDVVDGFKNLWYLLVRWLKFKLL